MRYGRRFRPAVAVLAGRFELAAQEFPDLAQASNLGLERSRCVVVRRLGVGALRHRRIDAMEFGGFDLPLAVFVLVAADFACLDRPQKRPLVHACGRCCRCKR